MYGKPIRPVAPRNKHLKVPESIICPHCGAPHNFLYFNNGVQKSQFCCKVCKNTFIDRVIPRVTKYLCPYCHGSLFRWKEQENMTLYKCGNNNCQCYNNNWKKLNEKERILYQQNPGHFTLHYIFREYHFDIKQLHHSEPLKPVVNLTKIHNSQFILGLILTFFVSFALSARKTALILRMVFQINISHQTVYNYCYTASYYCHLFNMQYKGTVDDIMAGDETYIKVNGKNRYIWFFINSLKRSISAYHYSDSRETQPAIVALNEAKRTAQPDQKITFVTDANPSYPAALQFLNSVDNNTLPAEHRKVTGLQNLDTESEENRTFKQLIERLNRTYKSHIKQTNGFNSSNGAIALTTLFVTYYNFLRPHTALKYKVPVQLDFLEKISTIQAKWIKIISMAMDNKYVKEQNCSFIKFS